MPFKYDENGNIVTQEVGGVRLPVFIHADKKETPLDADGTIARISALNAEAQGHRVKKEEFETQLSALKTAIGEHTPEDVKKALETVKNIDDKKLVDAGKVEEVRNAATKAMQERLDAATQAAAQQITALTQERDTFKNKFHREIIGGAFARSKFIQEKLIVPQDMVEALFGQQIKIEDDKLVAYDSQGQRISSRLRPGDLYPDLDEALEIIIDAYPHKDRILKGTQASGGGAQQGGQGGGGKTITRAAYEALDPAARASALKDKVLVD